jgi:hypothetical protein
VLAWVSVTVFISEKNKLLESTVKNSCLALNKNPAVRFALPGFHEDKLLITSGSSQ